MIRLINVVLLSVVVILPRELLGQQQTSAFQSAQELIKNFNRGSNGVRNNHDQVNFSDQQVNPQFSQQKNHQDEFSRESFQGRILKEQEDFRKSVAEANGVALNPIQRQGASFKSQQTFFDQSTPLNSGSIPEQRTFQHGQLQHQFPAAAQRSQVTLFEPIQQNVFNQQDAPAQTFQRIRTDNSEKFVRPSTSKRVRGRVNTVVPLQTQSELLPQVTQPKFQDNFAELSGQNDPNVDLSRVQLTGRPRQNLVRQRQRFQTVQDTTDDYETVRQQAENAKYSFTSQVNDGINDHNHVRAETRDGLKVDGVYSYSDGFFKRTVHYEADENGYRVVKQEVEPIGDGPQTNPAGKAEVSSNILGTNIQYSITGEDIPIRHHATSVLRQSN